MIFLSQLFNVPIVDNRLEEIGRLKDVVVREKGDKYPEVSGIVLKMDKKNAFIPYQFIENLSYGEITLNKTNCWKMDHEFASDETQLVQDILDKQIFDVGGVRVVRVNDLELVKVDEKFLLVGIDVSNRALLRRLGLVHMPFLRRLKSNLIDWNKVSMVKGPAGNLQLETSREKLEKLHPADIANLIENLNLQESTKLVQSFDNETAAEVLGEVDPKYKDTLLERMHPTSLAKILEEMAPDEAADVINDLSHHKRIQVFRKLGLKKAKTLHKLTRYKDNIAGGLMTSEFMHVNKDSTVAQAIRQIRKKSEEHGSIYHVFVVDDDKHLLGVVSIRTLLLASGRTRIEDVMANVVRPVRVHTKADEVSRVMTKYNLLSVAVVDKNKVIRGIITVDDILRYLNPEA
jgi:CBS domain-containing protein/sporulation protein YlmC with PRC-barrel domain